MIPDRLSVCLSGAMPIVRKEKLYFKNLPAPLQGKRVLFATDVHHGRFFSLRALKQLLDMIAALEPDLIVWGGDYAESPEGEQSFWRAAARLRPPLGMFAVPGNNDFEQCGGDYARLREWLGEAGGRLLVNERAEMELDGARLILTGLDEMKYGAPDAAMAAPEADGGAFQILVTHSPRALDLVYAGYDGPLPDLALAGHTHGAQMRLGNLSIYTLHFEDSDPRRQRFFRIDGLHEIEGMKLLVSAGIGTSLLPLRVGAPPEMHLLRLFDQSAENAPVS